MIRRTILDSMPCIQPLLRSVYDNDEMGKRRNKLIKLRHAIHHIPYEASRIALTLRDNRMRKKLSKRILLKFHIPLELFEHLRDYVYDNNYDFIERLPSMGYSRTIHHLIRTECIQPQQVDAALAVGKMFDTEYKHRPYVYTDPYVFRASVLIFVDNIPYSTYEDICGCW
jgi:hypothetical protein